MIIILFKKIYHKLRYLYNAIKGANNNRLHEYNSIDIDNVYVITDENDVVVVSNHVNVDAECNGNIYEKGTYTDSYRTDSIEETIHETENLLEEDKNNLDKTIRNLLTELIQNCDVNTMDKLVYIMLENNVKLNVDYDILDIFWQKNTEQILNYCKRDPKLITYFGLKDLDKELRLQILSTFSMKIFNNFIDESMLLCKHNLNLISYNITKKNIKLGRMIDNTNMTDKDNKIIYKNAFAALSKHKYGVAYVLFKKINDKKGMKQIHDKFVPDYIKELVDFGDDF